MEKIRIATKNFLCEKCNQLINNGDKYYDWWNTTSKDVYYHRRFHLECLENKTNKIIQTIKSNKPSIIERIEKLLKEENGCILAVNYKEKVKCYICGIHYSENGTQSILCETWGDKNPYYVNIEDFKKNYIDYKGDYF